MSGSRGRISSPNSVRGQKAARKAKKGYQDTSPAPSGALSAPGWLPDANLATWERVLGGLEAAGVPLQAVDAESLAHYCVALDGAAKAAAAGDMKLFSRLTRDCNALGILLGTTPAARARLNVQPPKAPEPENPWVKLARDTPGQ